MRSAPAERTRHTKVRTGQPTPSARVRRRARGFIIAVAAFVAVVALPGRAGAHAELTSSTPTEGATVVGPLDHISLEFLNPVVAVEDQFQLLDGGGEPVAIARVEPAGETTSMSVIPETPLEAGAFGLKWAARAGDSHPRVGTVTFTVEAAAAPAPAPSAGTEASDSGASAGTEHTRGSAAGHTTASGLHEALATPDTGVASSIGTAVRFFIYTGLLLAVGGILYLALVHRGTRGEGRKLVFLVRRAAVLAMLATLVELPLQAILLDGGSTDAIAAAEVYSDLLGSDFGIGVLLRILGAVLILVGMRMQLDRLDDDPRGLDLDDAPTLEHELVAHGGVATRVRPAQVDHRHRVRVEGSPIAMLGAVALVVSEVFIGHTASTEPRWLVIASTVVHLVAASLWVAGIAMLAITLWRRHRHGAELEAALLATRFSVAAVGAVVAVSVTGLALGIAILGDAGALVSTEFGRLLLAKVALVAVLVGLGGYNQRVVIPSLERRRTARRAGHRLRWVVTAEVVTFLAITAVTAALVGANSSG
jgi:copper transport protein